MKEKDLLRRLHDAIENYYHFNPDTLMPLLMLSLATQSKLSISERATKPEFTACTLRPNEIMQYEWVTLNHSLKQRISAWMKNNITQVNVEMNIGRSLLPIYNIFKQNDEVTVINEYHHRIGKLIQQSDNEASENAQRQYATYVLAEALLNTPIDSLKNCYLQIFNHILVKSELQPKRPRLDVAYALNSLLQYDGKGLVYNPFAGCSIAGAMIKSENNYYGDGDANDKLYAAALLLNYGMGVSNENFIQRDSTKWLNNKKTDYVLSTYMGYINGKTSFDFCLGKCLEDKNFTGKYAGMVQPKEIFEKQSDNFKKALKQDWISTIALLPFGEMAILVDANKNDSEKGIIKFINGTNPLARTAKIDELLEEDMYAEIISVKDALKKGYLKSKVVYDLPEREGYKKVRLGDYVKKIPKKVYNLDKFEEDDRILAYINRSETYYGNRWDENIEKRHVSNLFGPAYHLNEDALIVNKTGLAEPRLYNAANGSAFFEDGYAFSLDGLDNPIWIVNELKETYVRKQLHPYGLNNMIIEALTEDDYLNLTLYIKQEEYEEDIPSIEDLLDQPSEEEYEEPDDIEEGADGLEEGFILTDGNMRYTILNFIANGSFGYTYRAEMLNCRTGAKEIVAIKEFYPTGVGGLHCSRDNNRVIYNEIFHDQFLSYMEMFKSEPEFILSMNNIPDNHVTEVKSMFKCEETGTMYYVMKYYSGESLKDMIISGQVPTSEDLIVKQIIIPMCKALKAMHTHNILHLDIKPENIVIDENGEAVLIDFGVAQQYDDNGRLVSSRDTHSYSPFSAPENKDGNMRYFGPAADIFGLAATLFTLFSNRIPRPICNQEDYFGAERIMECSEQMKKAILEGMSEYSNDRPANAQLFLNLFPGCENTLL